MNKSNIDLLPYPDKQKQALQKLVSMLQEISDVKKIILFGSYARMEQTVQSDFDILAITETDISREQRGHFCSLFEEQNADLIFYTEKQFQVSDCLLVQQIRKDGILLWSS